MAEDILLSSHILEETEIVSPRNLSGADDSLYFPQIPAMEVDHSNSSHILAMAQDISHTPYEQQKEFTSAPCHNNERK
jgi:hypothetical protein